MNRFTLTLLVLLLATVAAAQTGTVPKAKRVLRIGVRSDVRFILTDPGGRSAGFDRNTGLATTQIPLSTPTETCSQHQGSTPSPCIREIAIENPMSGEYRMEIEAAQGGSYGLYWSDESDGQRSKREYSGLPIGTGETQVYEFTSAANAADDTLRGDFGGAQAEGAADRLITWGRPDSASSNLPAGTDSYQPIIVYAATVIPASFRADLNGTNVTGLFHPAPHNVESVRLLLRAGRNALKVVVNGTISSRPATDTDTLEFKVP